MDSILWAISGRSMSQRPPGKMQSACLKLLKVKLHLGEPGREKRCSADWDVGKLQKNGWRAWKKPLPRFSALSETGWFQPKSSHWISGLKRSNMEKPKVSTMQTTMPPWLFAMYTLSFAQRSVAQSISKRVVSYWLYNMGCSIGVPQNSWFKMEKTYILKWMMYISYKGTTISGNLHVTN